MFRLLEVSEAKAIHLLHVGVGCLEAEVRVLRIVLDEVMISRQRQQIFALSAESSLLPTRGADANAPHGEVHSHAHGLNDGASTEHGGVSRQEEHLNGAIAPVQEHRKKRRFPFVKVI